MPITSAEVRHLASLARLGMTAEEVQKYINEVAFSGAEEFISESGVDGEVSVDSVFFLCVRKEVTSICDIGQTEDAIPSAATKENNGGR